MQGQKQILVIDNDVARRQQIETVLAFVGEHFQTCDEDEAKPALLMYPSSWKRTRAYVRARTRVEVDARVRMMHTRVCVLIWGGKKGHISGRPRVPPNPVVREFSEILSRCALVPPPPF